MALREADLGEADTEEASGGLYRFGAVGARLRSPVEAIDLAGFAARFHARTIRIRVEGEAATAADLRFLGRVRGAIGDLLVEAASPEAVAGQPCPWEPPCAFEALFRKQGRLSLSPSVEFPSPYVLAADPAGADLDVRLTLFGFACEWMPAAAEILAAALAHRLDFAYAGGGRHSGPPRLAMRNLIATNGLALGGGAFRRLELVLRTPLTAQADNPGALVSGARHRLEGLARWHDATLSGVDWFAVTEAAHRLRYRWTERRPVAWARASRRQNREMRLAGALGRIEIDGEPADLAAVHPVLGFGAAIHLGADLSLGCGRFDLLSQESAARSAKSRLERR